MRDQSSTLVFLRYLTTAFDNIKDGVMLIDIEPGNVYRLVLANRAFHDSSGFAADAVGKNVQEITSPENFKHIVKRYQKVRGERRPIKYIRWTTVPAGRRAYEVQLLPVFNTVDEVVQIIAITRDVSALLRLKEEVQALRAQVTDRKN